MIQRIQSIYLLIGALALLSLLLFDTVWTGPVAEEQIWFAPAVLISAGLAAAVAVVTIFLYKNRKQQRTIVGVVQLLTMICLAVLAAGLYLGRVFQIDTGGWSSTDLAIVLVPVVAYVMFFLARRAIDRDITLIRSMDRLR
jgi:hypothetical protein